MTMTIIMIIATENSVSVSASAVTISRVVKVQEIHVQEMYCYNFLHDVYQSH